ncbi:hypothetical protein E1B28_004128, partial [Marasmius oreades]
QAVGIQYRDTSAAKTLHNIAYDVVDKLRRLAILVDCDISYLAATKCESSDDFFAVAEPIEAFFSAIEACSQNERIVFVLLVGKTSILDEMPTRPVQLRGCDIP